MHKIATKHAGYLHVTAISECFCSKGLFATLEFFQKQNETIQL